LQILLIWRASNLPTIRRGGNELILPDNGGKIYIAAIDFAKNVPQHA
jgi:hypothetical protein